MNTLEWGFFLKSWQNEVMLLISLIPDHVLDQQAKANQFADQPMRPPADKDAVYAAQSRLKVNLPEELVSFYLASNGWSQYGFDEYSLKILPIADLCYLSASEQVRDEVFGYADFPEGGAQGGFFRKSDLNNVVIISDHDSGCYLASVSGPSTGECAVVRWHAAPQLFSSFEDLMVSEKVRCLEGLRSLLD